MTTYLIGNTLTKVDGDLTGLEEYLTFTPRSTSPEGEAPISLLHKNKFPSGLIEYVRKKYPGEVIDTRTPPTLSPLKFPLKAELFDFQKEAVDMAISKTMGILHLPVSAGKTYIAIEIFRRLGLKTLYLVPRNELMIQSASKLRELIDAPIEIGLCGDSIIQDGQIVFSSIFSAHNLDLTQFQLVIADECHRAPAKTYFDIVMGCINAHYRIGISGTVSGRYDEMEILNEACIGPVIYNVGMDTLKKCGLICDSEVIFLESIIPQSVNLYSIPEQYRRRYFSKIETTCIVKNSFRNNQIQQIASLFKGKTILIFVKRVEHGEILSSLIPDSIFCDGSMSISKRMSVLANIEGKVLIATSIFEEGVDLKVFDVILLASGGKSPISLTQKIGRGLRNRPGKKLYVFDFLDIGGNTFIETMSRSRLKHLQASDFNVRIQRLPNSQELREFTS